MMNINCIYELLVSAVLRSSVENSLNVDVGGELDVSMRAGRYTITSHNAGATGAGTVLDAARVGQG